VVQTEDEKLAAKLARKERRKHGGRDEEDESAISSAMLGFDQDDLRKAREEQLRNNAAMPLASSQHVSVFFIVYRFVFVLKMIFFKVYHLFYSRKYSLLTLFLLPLLRLRKPILEDLIILMCISRLKEAMFYRRSGKALLCLQEALVSMKRYKYLYHSEIIHGERLP
jgi:hypothetical protein